MTTPLAAHPGEHNARRADTSKAHCPHCDGTGQCAMMFLTDTRYRDYDCPVCDGAGRVDLADITHWVSRNSRDAWMLDEVRWSLADAACSRAVVA